MLSKLVLLSLLTCLTGCAFLNKVANRLDCINYTNERYGYWECVEARDVHPEPITIQCKRISRPEEAEGLCSQLE